MQLVPALAEDKVHPPPDGLRPPGGPFLQNLPDAQHLGHPGNQDVEVAGEGILQGRLPVELGHQLIRVHAPLEVNGQLQSGEVRLVPHVGNLLGLAGFDQLRHLVQNGLYRSGVGDLVDLNEVFLFDIAVFGPDLHAAPAGVVDLPQDCGVADQLAAGGKIRGQQRLRQVAVRVFEVGDRGVADLFEVKPAELRGHAHGNAAVGGDQDIGKGGGQQGRLLHGVVIVVHKVHGVAVDVLEDFLADGGQLCLRIPGSGPGHVPGVTLAEVALGVHKGGQQGAVAPGEADHGVINGGVPVGVQLHGLAHDVGRLGAGLCEEAHLVHGVEQFAVGGLEAVDLRDGPGDDDAHSVGHVVGLQGIGDGLLHHGGPEAQDVGVIYFGLVLIWRFLLRHSVGSLLVFFVEIGLWDICLLQ